MKRLLTLVILCSSYVFLHQTYAFGNFQFGQQFTQQQQYQQEPKSNQILGFADEDDVDLYAILELNEDSSIAQVKKAYRQLSMKFHPDRNKDDPAAHDKFRRLTEAYDILNDEEKKLLYDQGGMPLLRQGIGQSSAMHQGGGLLSALFGGAMGMQQGSKTDDVNLELKLNLEDFYNGVEREIMHSRRIICRGCKSASKSSDLKKIDKCKSCKRCPAEMQMVQKELSPGFIVQQQEEVKSKERCKEETKPLEILVERGMKSGEKLRFRYMAEQKPKMIPGDVYVSVQQNPHHLFQRKENDLHMDLQISLKESLIGFTRKFQHLDGREVLLDSKELKPNASGQTFKPFEVIKIPGEGMPVHEVPSQFGDLYVKFEIIFPNSLQEDQKAAIRDLF